MSDEDICLVLSIFIAWVFGIGSGLEGKVSWIHDRMMCRGRDSVVCGVWSQGEPFTNYLHHILEV